MGVNGLLYGVNRLLRASRSYLLFTEATTNLLYRLLLSLRLSSFLVPAAPMSSQRQPPTYYIGYYYPPSSYLLHQCLHRGNHRQRRGHVHPLRSLRSFPSLLLRPPTIHWTIRWALCYPKPRQPHHQRTRRCSEKDAGGPDSCDSQ